MAFRFAMHFHINYKRLIAAAYSIFYFQLVSSDIKAHDMWQIVTCKCMNLKHNCPSQTLSLWRALLGPSVYLSQAPVSSRSD